MELTAVLGLDGVLCGLYVPQSRGCVLWIEQVGQTVSPLSKKHVETLKG